eukprot:TRINITY_DN64517_c0_g1_i1.p1 TRINITY_DN64517_c0_g1~~TRINITY_DN64517_c0_g1_i1.p1  ORF type:complete len:754 (-),score=235.61 TRINITY_DN64517_c0_g1_i1:63-2324(-)
MRLRGSLPMMAGGRASMFLATVLLLNGLFICTEAVQVGHKSRRGILQNIVKMLEEMQDKVREEGKTHDKVNDEYKCYCKKNNEIMTKELEDTEKAMPERRAKLRQLVADKTKLEVEIAQHKKDQKESQEAVAQANALRSKEANANLEEGSSMRETLDGLMQAISALEKGMSGAFLQTKTADKLQKITQDTDSLTSEQRDILASFFQSKVGDGYTPASAQILGILKQMKEDMMKDMKDASMQEAEKLKEHQALMDANQKEMQAAMAGISEKMDKMVQIAMDLSNLKRDLQDAEKIIKENTAFLVDLKHTCKNAEHEHEDYVKNQAQELKLLREVVTMLQSDEARASMSKAARVSLAQKQAMAPPTTPTPYRDPLADSAPSTMLLNTGTEAVFSFLQVASGDDDGSSLTVQGDDSNSAPDNADSAQDAAPAEEQAPALPSGADKSQVISALQASGDTRVSLIELALRGDKKGFKQVLNKIDELRELLDEEQREDDNQRDYCEKKQRQVAENKVVQQRSVDEARDTIEISQTMLGDVNRVILEMENRIKDLDKEVAEATADRKKAHMQFMADMSTNRAAQDLMFEAKNKLSSFYTKTSAFVQESNKGRSRSDQRPELKAKPEGSLKFNTGSRSSKVEMMFGKLQMGLAKQVMDLKQSDQQGQMDYESIVGRSNSKKEMESQMLAQKQVAKAELEETLQENKASLESNEEKLEITLDEIQTLGKQCNFLVKNFDIRRKARSNEKMALERAKSTLSEY